MTGVGKDVEKSDRKVQEESKETGCEPYAIPKAALARRQCTLERTAAALQLRQCRALWGVFITIK
jgi:hypothetical protein